MAAAKENAWTPFVRLLMGQNKTGPMDKKTDILTAGLFGSNGATYYVDPGFKGAHVGWDVDENDEKKKTKVCVADFPTVNEIKALWTGLQTALKDDRNNDFTKSGIMCGGRKFMFSKVAEVFGKDVKEGAHKCVIGRCKSSSIILTPHNKSFSVIVSQQNAPVGNIVTHCFVAASLKKSGQ
jgi:hypothetical protein